MLLLAACSLCPTIYESQWLLLQDCLALTWSLMSAHTLSIYWNSVYRGYRKWNYKRTEVDKFLCISEGQIFMYLFLIHTCPIILMHFNLEA